MATSAADTDFGKIIGAVARDLWGEPNKRLSKPGALRWGNQGARIVYTSTGAFKDTEADRAGGTLELVQHVQRTDQAGAVRWLIEHGHIPERAREHALRLDTGQRIVATYRYETSGVLHYRKHRIEPGRGGRKKDFLYDHPDGLGGWKWGRGPAAQIPYRADAFAGAETVIFAEGEAKADKLASWGFAATSSKDWLPGFAEHLRGKRVIILPDNDRTGAQIEAEVRRKLGNAPSSIITVALPGLDHAGDILDWAGTADELRALIEQAPIAEPEAALPPGDDPIGEMHTVASMAGIELPEQQWLVDQMIPVGAGTTFFGNGGDGKTLTAMQIGVAVERGIPIFGAGTTQANVHAYFCEDPKEELDRRFRAICRNEGVSQASVTGFEYQSRFGRESLLGMFGGEGEFIPSAFYHAIKQRAVMRGARLLILDNILHLYPGNVNDPGEVTRFLAAINALALAIRGAVLLLGHTAKADGSTFMGTMAWSNASRSRLFIGRPGDLETGSNASVFDDPDARIFARLKANYAPIGAPMPIRWIQGSFVHDDHLPEDKRAEIAAVGRANEENEAFLSCLRVRDREGEGRQVGPSPGPNYAPTQFEGMAQAKGFTKQRLKRAMDRLFTVGRIESYTYRNTAKARDVTIIREVEGAPRTTPNATPNPSRTLVPNPPEPLPELSRTHTVDTTYLWGAAKGAAAPSFEERKAPDLTRTVFPADDPDAPDDDGAGNSIGWNP